MAENKFERLKFRITRSKAFCVFIEIDKPEGSSGITVADGEQAILLQLGKVPAEQWQIVPESKIQVTLVDAEEAKTEGES